MMLALYPNSGNEQPETQCNDAIQNNLEHWQIYYHIYLLASNLLHQIPSKSLPPISPLSFLADLSTIHAHPNPAP